MKEHGARLRLRYEYDFGDGWQHEVVLENVTEPVRGAKYPRCVDGERACPPEDVGGVRGFVNFIKAMRNPRHNRHAEYFQWHGPFDPTAFDAEKTTRRMKKGLPAW